jgi:hypothetical protein
MDPRRDQDRSMTFIHPETGEVLATEEEWKAALVSVNERLSVLYAVRRKLWEYNLRPDVQLPPPRYRTEKQDQIARCPRCGMRIDANAR